MLLSPAQFRWKSVNIASQADQLQGLLNPLMDFLLGEFTQFEGIREIPVDRQMGPQGITLVDEAQPPVFDRGKQSLVSAADQAFIDVDFS
jgi:hypothetical protein